MQSGAGLHADTLVGAGHRIPILYGRCLISPDLAKAKALTSAGVTRGSYDAVISEGPIDAIESWYGATTSDFQSIVTTLGSLSPTAGTPSWSIGLAMASIVTKATKPWYPRCIARGRTPYDPRLGAWGAGSYPDAAKCAYTTNPALAYLDLRVFPQFGCDWPKVPPSLVDWTSVTAAANHFDELVDGAKRYELNLYLQAAETADQWLKTIELHVGLRWREEGGLYRLDYSAPTTAVAAAITDDHIVKGSVPRWSYGSGAGLADRPNRFRAEWIDPASSWAIRTVEVRHPEVDAGAAIRDGQVYKLHGFQSEAMAQRALWRIAHEVWSEQEFECELTTERLDLVEGSRVPVTLSSLGLSAVEHIVTRTSYDADRVRITARRYDATTWTPDASDSGALPGGGFFDTPPALANATYQPRVDVTVEGSTTHTLWRPGVIYDFPTFTWSKQVRLRCAILGQNTPGTIAYVSVSAGGVNYGVDDIVEIHGEGTSATAKVATVSATGAILTVTVLSVGSGYWPQTTFATVEVAAPGSGCGLTVSITPTGDPTTLTWDSEEMVRNEFLLPVGGNEAQANADRAWAVIESLIAAFDNTTSGDFFDGGAIIGGWHAMRLMIRLESLAGLLGAASTFDQAAVAYSSSSSNLNEPVYHVGDLTVNTIPKVNATGDGRLVDSKLVDTGTDLLYSGTSLLGGGALTVEEADGAPSVANVVTIKFAAGTTVADDGAGVVTVTPPSGGGGASPVLATDSFVATASQTAFVLASAPLASGVVYVTRDGVTARAADWTLVTATITFGTGLDAGVEVQVGYWTTAPTGLTPFGEGFVATAGQTDFTLTHAPYSVLLVAVAVIQKPTAWSIVSSTTLSFVTGLAADDDVWISYLY
ncbi:MAG: phage tail protein [Elusimicrobiota bacterium]